MSERRTVIPAVLVVVQDKDSILLHRRMGTGFRDGEYDVPSGHIEEGETAPEAAARELEEESGLRTTASELELFHVFTNDFETPGKPYLYFFFKIGIAACSGVFEIKEPNKCDDMGMFPVSQLPNTVPHVAESLSYINSETVTFSKL